VVSLQCASSSLLFPSLLSLRRFCLPTTQSHFILWPVRLIAMIRVVSVRTLYIRVDDSHGDSEQATTVNNPPRDRTAKLRARLPNAS